MMDKSGENGYPCLVPFLTGKSFQPFIIEYDISCGFIVYDLYSVEVCSFNAKFIEAYLFFIMKGCILSKAFLTSLGMII